MAQSALPPQLDGLELRSLTYVEASALLESLSDLELLKLFDHSSIKLGDTAYDKLGRRGADHLVIEAVHKHQLKTRNGKVRAANFLQNRGRTLKEAHSALMVLVADSNKDAVSTALLGIILWRDLSVIPELKALYLERKNSRYLEAIEALEKGDHRIYSKYFAPDQRWD